MKPKDWILDRATIIYTICYSISVPCMLVTGMSAYFQRASYLCGVSFFSAGLLSGYLLGEIGKAILKKRDKKLLSEYLNYLDELKRGSGDDEICVRLREYPPTHLSSDTSE